MTIRCLLIFFVVFAPGMLLAQQSSSKDSLVAVNVATLNTNETESNPFLTFDQNTIYFDRVSNNKTRIWTAQRLSDSLWTEPTILPGTDKLGDLGAYISDTLDEIFFASDYGAKAPNDIDIFCFSNGKINNLGAPVNTTAWETQPSITPDGQDLYFASNREGPKDRVKIFVSHRSSDGKWSDPVNVGSKINSRNYNGFPFILSDKKTLLFASGISKFKLYISTKTGSGDANWSDPIELPFPINNAAASISPCLSSDNNELFFASDRMGGKGKMDIYMVRLPHGLASLYPQPTK
jgi:hypothetical protein